MPHGKGTYGKKVGRPPQQKKKVALPKSRPKSLKADKTVSLDKKWSANITKINKKNKKNVKRGN